MTGTALSTADRLASLLQRLALRRVHLAAGFAPNAVAFARSYPDAVASLTLICPLDMTAEPFLAPETPMLVFFGGSGPNAVAMPELLASFPQATRFPLPEYDGAPWSDAVADRRHDLWPTMLTFLSAANDRAALEPAGLSEGVGDVDGIMYRVRGSGPPLVLLPLSLARSQWEPFIAELAARYTTILLGGAHLGVVPMLETRIQGGYRNVVRSVVDTAQPQPGDRVLEVGCGPGPVARWLARHLPLDNPITAVDVNGYLLGEASSLTNADGLGDRIEFQHGDAESLPFAAESFDVTLSFTVMEEVDADRMLAEVVRVTRPGGRVAVVVRATDLPRFLNVSLPPELESRALLMSAPRVGVDQHGCGDSSLYRRFVKAGLSDLIMGPQLAPETLERSVERMRIYVDRLVRALSTEDARQFSEAINQAVEDRTLVYAEPFHCAVGVKR